MRKLWKNGARTHTHTQIPSVPLFFQYVLNDKISYPEETFMDWEFKISVMYDIAKVRQVNENNTASLWTAATSWYLTPGMWYHMELFEWLKSMSLMSSLTQTHTHIISSHITDSFTLWKTYSIVSGLHYSD